MDVPLIVAVPIEQIKVIELGLDILRPRCRVSITECTVPFLRVSPRVLDPHKSMYLGAPILLVLDANLSHVQDSVVVAMLQALSQSKSVEIVLPLVIHLREHLEIELAPEDAMVET